MKHLKGIKKQSPSLLGAHLFIPANNAGFLTTIPLIDIQNIIIDLEFATPSEHKSDARYLCRNAVGYIRELMGEGNINISVRINIPSDKQLVVEDLRVVLEANPDSIRIPSVNTAEEIRFVENQIKLFEEKNHLILPIHLHPMIETSEGLKNASEIAIASPRNEALCFGGEDYAINCNLQRTKGGKELEAAKLNIFAVATNAGLFPIDTVHNWLDDIDSLTTNCKRSLCFGFRARATINPRQIKTINKIYNLTDANPSS